MLIKMGTSKMKRGNSHNVIVKNYEHYNRSFKNWNSPYGRYIGSKAEYEKAMAEEGMVKANEQIKDVSKEYKLSHKGQQLIEAAKAAADSNGNIDHSKLGDKAIKAISPQAYDRSALPAHYQEK